MIWFALALSLLCVGRGLAQSPATVTLSPVTSPASGQPGVHQIAVTGSNFPAGASNASQVSVTLTPAVLGSGPTVVVPASSIQTVTGTTRRVMFLVPANLVFATSTAYRVTLGGSANAFLSGNSSALTISPPAKIVSLVSNTAGAGTSLTVTITGQNTNFLQGSTQAYWGPGISVGGGSFGAFGPVTVLSPTSATATLNINATAAPGARSVTIATGAQQATLQNGFAVIAAGPALLSVYPNAAQQGQTNLTVTMTGQNTHFAQGLTQITLGVGVSVSSVNILSPVSASAVVSIDSGASVGARTVTAQTGTESAVLVDGFVINSASFLTVNAGTPQTIALPSKAKLSGSVQAPVDAVVTTNWSLVSGPGSVAFDDSTNLATWGRFAQPGTHVLRLTASTGVLERSADVVIVVTFCASGKEIGIRLKDIPGGPIVELPGGGFRMYTTRYGEHNPLITHTSQDALQWNLEMGASLDRGNLQTAAPINILRLPSGQTRMYYSGRESNGILRIYSAISNDGLVFTSESGVRVDVGGPFGCIHIGGGDIIQLPNGWLRMYYSCGASLGIAGGDILSSTSTDGLTWIQEPGIRLRRGSNSGLDEFPGGPDVQKLPDGRLRMYYTAGLNSIPISHVFSAISSDGLSFAPEQGIRIDVGAPGSPDSYLASGSLFVELPDNTFRVYYLGYDPNPINLLSARWCGVESNNPPTVNAGASQTVLLPANSTTLAGSATDDGLPNGATLTYSWSVASGPGNVTFSAPNSLTTQAQFSAFGQYLLRLTVSDSQLYGYSDVVVDYLAANLLVSPNSASPGISTPLTIVGQNTHFSQGQTTLNFGAGVSVDSVSVTNPTSLTARITVAPVASFGTRDVIAKTGGEIVTAVGAMSIVPLPVISVTPATMAAGQSNVAITISGQNTHFLQGVTQVHFGPGVSVSSVLVPNASSLTATISIDPSASGPRTITVTTGPEIVTLPNGFTISTAAPSPMIYSVSPSGASQGQSLILNVSGLSTHFLQGGTTVDLGPGISVMGVSVTCGTCLSAQVMVSDSAPIGTRMVTVTTGAEVAAISGFTVSPGTPIIQSFGPTSGQPGQTFTLAVNGRFTHFAQGTTLISLGAGVTVSNVVVSSGASLTAQVTISSAAAFGPRTLTVVTGTEIVSVTNGFAVQPPLPILYSLTPGSAQQGQQNVAIAVVGQNTHFAQGTTQAAFGAGVTVTSVSVSSATTATVVVTVDSAAAVGARTVTLTTGTEAAGFPNGFTVLQAVPILTQINPGGGQLGQSGLSVAIKAFGTHFVQGLTQASFGSGVTVVAITVASPTLATALVNIDPAAPLGNRTVTLTTGTESASLANGFAVTAGGPALTIINPGAGSQGQPNLAVSITGVNTHFVQGTTQVSFDGTGITVNSVTVTNATNVSANISIAATAATGNRSITITTGTEVVSAPSAFTIQPGVPTILSVTPASGSQGQQNLNVTINGLFTHFVQGSSQVSFAGTAVVVNSVTVASATSLTANVSIATNALAAPRSVTVTTGSEVASLLSGFVVNTGINQTPVVTIVPTWSVTLPSRLTVNYTVTDDLLPASGALTVSWQTISGPGNAGFLNQTLTDVSVGFDQPGTYVLRLRATDMQLTATQDLTVTVAPAPPPPVVSILTPSDGAEVTARINVTGTVTSPSLAAWTLEYRMASDTGFTPIATSAIPVTNGILATFDPTILLNGIAFLQLRATDTVGQSSTFGPVSLTLTKNQKIGNFTVSFNDMTVPMPGMAIQVVRTYDSRQRKSPDDFGYGWTLDLKTVRTSENIVMGKGWQGTVTGTTLPTYCIQPARSHIVTVTLPDNTTYRFQPTLTPSCQQLVPIDQVAVGFAPMPNTSAALSVVGNNLAQRSGSVNGPFDLIDLNTTLPFDPQQYQLTLSDGRVLVLDKVKGLQTMTDLSGNKLTITSTGIQHTSGKSVVFTREPASQNITKITDPAGNAVSYAYNVVTGDLTSVTDRENLKTEFTYDGTHGLLSIKDPRGVQPIRNVYDSSGRLIQNIDAFGNTINYTHNLGTSQEVVTDRLGNVTVNEYDADGNVVRVTDALGGVTVRTYDSRGNMLTETSPLGKTRTFTYDAQDNRLTETDPLGNATTYTYNGRKQVLTITDPLGRVTTNTYDGSGNLLTTKDALNQLTTYTYDSRGLQTSVTDPLGSITRYEYDASGNQTKVTDPLGNVTTYSYDVSGNRVSETKTRTTPSGPETLVTSFQYNKSNQLVKTTYPDGSTTQVVYNAIGKQSATIDQLNRQTTFTYDNMGRLTRTDFPDGTNEQSTYDAEGRRLTSIDRGGRTTSYSYDKLGRLTKTTFADTAASHTVFDAAGQVTQSIDARGNATSFTYDDAGRRTRVTNALGQATQFEYDKVGNQTAVIDARGNRTQYGYDALNRRAVVTYPDGTSDQSGFDALGRSIAKTDQAGKVTQFGYDRLGRLLNVTDALNQVTSYAYDELGNRTSQTDAKGRVTRFEYDKMGRRTKRTLPMGQVETMTYDAAGSLKTKTDFNGRVTTYAYDAANRLLSKTPDPFFAAAPVVFTYTATGQRLSMTDPSGVTTYTYDLRDRLTRKATPQGALSYTWDLQGNLTGIRSSNIGGTSVDYAYDALNRLSQVTDNRLAPNGVTTYAYDAAGNLDSYTYPNGVKTTHTYNTLNRLTNLASAKGATTVSSYGYTLGQSGNRTKVVELGGRTVDYAYDALYRLTTETITGAAVNGVIGYTYDAVGNRLTRTSTVAPVPAASYSYNDNDQLASDTYDSNGNTTASGGVSYGYEFENRLRSKNGTEVTIVYDGDGNRVAKTVASITTKYLVDDRNLTGYAQVVEEPTGAAIARVYTYGLDLISQSQASSTNFYGYDGQGNVRILTDATGAVTDRNEYEAFGGEMSTLGSTPNSYMFLGEQYDRDLQNIYLRARYYTPSMGRFFSLDPFDGASTDPYSFHKYLYANADPANKHDPSGLLTLGEAVNTVAIYSILSAAYLEIRYPKRSGSGIGPDAALFGVSFSGTPRQLNSTVFQGLVDLAVQALPSWGAIISELTSPVTQAVQQGQMGVGITAGCELIATATDRKAATSCYWGPTFNIGPGATGYQANFYTGVVWGVPSYDTYKGTSGAVQFEVGLKSGGFGLGATFSYFTNFANQYGQLTGLATGPGVGIALNAGAVFYPNPPVLRNLDYRPLLFAAWPPPMNLLLARKAGVF